MFDKVKAILAKQLRKDPAIITPESRIKRDLGADSIDILQDRTVRIREGSCIIVYPTKVFIQNIRTSTCCTRIFIGIP